MINCSSDNYSGFKCESEQDQLIRNFFYSLILTEVLYAVVPHWVWDYRKWIAAEDPYRGNLYKFLAKSKFVHAVYEISGQKTQQFPLLCLTQTCKTDGKDNLLIISLDILVN